MLDQIDPQDYDIICISAVRGLTGDDYTKSCFSFALFLASHWNVPTFVGGALIIKNLSLELVHEYQRECALPHVVVVDGPGLGEFTRFLNDTPMSKLTALPYQKYRGNKLSNYTPKVDLGNKDDVQVNVQRDYFSPELVARYPEIQAIPRFHIIPYSFTSGCRFSCAFCMTSNTEYSTLTPSQSVDHLECMVNRGASNFRFFNTNINMSLRFAIDFANEIVRRGLKIRFSDSCNLRITSREMFAALGEAGCIKLWYGADSMSPKIQALIHKRQDVEKMLVALEDAYDSGICNAINLIHSFPHESDEDFQMMIDFVRRTKDICFTYQVNHFQMFPNIPYRLNPEKYNVNIRKTRFDRYAFDYDEVGGLSWEETLERRQVRHHLIFRELDKSYRRYRQNDDLLFALSHLDISLVRKREIFDATYQELLRANVDMSQFHYEPELSVGSFEEMRRWRLARFRPGNLDQGTTTENSAFRD